MNYVFRWKIHGRQGQPCAVEARTGISGDGKSGPTLAFGTPARKRFNSVLLRFADGYGMIASGNSIKRRKE